MMDIFHGPGMEVGEGRIHAVAEADGEVTKSPPSTYETSMSAFTLPDKTNEVRIGQPTHLHSVSTSRGDSMSAT